MFSIKNNILCFIVLNILVQIQSLVEIPAIEDNEIVITESVVRSTVNKLFSNLKLKRVKHKARIKEFAVIHNFFVSITLQDHDNLKEIARLAKVNNIDNTTGFFITLLNEVLNEDNKSDEATEDNVSKLIGTFIKKLESLKETYHFNSNNGNFDINVEILKHLNRSDTNILQNVAKRINKANQSEDDKEDDGYWRPEESGRRVYGGHRVKIKRFPFMASVQFFKKFQCGGSIIKSDVVITAASCLQLAWNNRFFRENPAFLSVQVGCNFYEGGGENIPVQEVYFHPEYDPKNLANNLALMRLRRVMKLGKHVKKVKKIEFDRNPWPLPAMTRPITIVGWGARTVFSYVRDAKLDGGNIGRTMLIIPLDELQTSNILSDPWANRLGFARLDYYPLSECRDIYSKEYVTKKNFCAGFFSKGGGACNRDVGGPGVANGILVGVVSFGSPNCGAPDAPTVFTKLGFYKDWIESILDQNVPRKLAGTTQIPKTQSYDLNARIHTLTTFRIKPIGDKKRETAAVPIREVDVLRTLDDNVLFKEFLTTMFGSAEVKEYLDQSDQDADKEAEAEDAEITLAPTKDIPRIKVASKPAAKVKTTEATAMQVIDVPPADDQEAPIGSVKMVTTIEKFDRYSSSKEGVTVPEDLKKYTSLNDYNKEEYEKKVEQKIAKLIDDIDIQELLKSEPSNDEALVEEGTKKIVKETLVELKESDETVNTSSDDVESDYSLFVNNGSVVEGNKKEDDKNKEKVKEDEDGLSIPVGPSKDFTFRQNSSGQFLDLFSPTDLLSLFSKTLQSESKIYYSRVDRTK